jgi:Carboxypeptidase regulatory-like domain
MLTSPTLIRLFLFITPFCLSTAQRLGVAQTANIPQAEISRGGYKIAGTVISKTDGHSLAVARVVIRDVKNPRNFKSMISSEDGKFEFSGLPAGKYSLEGAKRGFISANYDQHDQFSTAIVTGAGLDTEGLVLRLSPNAVITGRVLDEVGDPVRHATVALYYKDHQQGVDQIHVFRNTQTDDLGTYEITPLMPGTYFLSATAQPWYSVHRYAEPNNSEPERYAEPAATVDRSLDVAYPLTYYADVTDAESATPIPIRGGDRLQVDIHLNPVPALRLIFHVPGDEKNGFTFPQLEQPAFEGSTFVHHTGGRMVSPGVLEITGISAGRYNIRISVAGQALQMNGVDLSKDGEEIDTSRGEALSSVKVSVQVPGGVTPSMQLAVGLRSGSKVMSAWQRIDSKGEAELQQISPGQYEVLVWGSGKRYSIGHVSAEGATVSGHTLTVTAGTSPSVSLTLVTGGAEVQGTAKRAGKAFAGAMVVLVPENLEGNRDLFRRDQSDLDGTFVLHGVVPGSYTLLAIENGWDLDWSQPDVIAAYMKPGRVIEIGNQTGHPLTLAEAIEVQSK